MKLAFLMNYLSAIYTQVFQLIDSLIKMLLFYFESRQNSWKLTVYKSSN